MLNGFVKVAAASPSVRVADVDYNKKHIAKMMDEAASCGVKAIVFPELSLTGYTSGDLFFQKKLLESSQQALLELIEASKGQDMITLVGYPHMHKGKIYNTAAAIFNGELLALIGKKNIPNYGDISEARWFASSPDTNVITQVGDIETLMGTKILIEAENMPSFVLAADVCEDLWLPIPESSRHALAGATIICNMSASVEIDGKEEIRKTLVAAQSLKLIAGYIYANAAPGESTTDLIFPGTQIIAENGNILRYRTFSDDQMSIAEIDVERISLLRARKNTIEIDDSEYDMISIAFDKVENAELTREIAKFPFNSGDESVRRARYDKMLTLQAMGLKRRVEHTRAESVVIGLSGGLDSTLALLCCVRAFDMLSRPRKDIIAISMPCFGTTQRTKSNAERLATALGVTFVEIDITESVKSHFRDIGQSLDDFSVTYENGQARERTQVLMDIANMKKGFVVGTGDLSELALGWATFNGDHMSMYGVNSSIPKTLMRFLVGYYGSQSEPEVESILSDILSTPVSPELLPAKDGVISQITEDIVGPYELHDFFLYYMVRYGFSPRKIYRLARCAFGDDYSAETVKKWLVVFIRRFFSQQFKRNCVPDGPKVGAVSLSARGDWKMPSDALSSIWIAEAENL